jgi:hypothetical protein
MKQEKMMNEMYFVFRCEQCNMMYERVEVDPRQICPVDTAHGPMKITYSNDKFIELYKKRIAELAKCACDDCSTGHKCPCEDK